MKKRIAITSLSSISSLGVSDDLIWDKYKDSNHRFSIAKGELVSKLPKEAELELIELQNENSKYRKVDRTVLLGILAARKAVENSKIEDLSKVGLNFSSSRGATELFEKYHQKFIESNHKKLSPLVSPNTTLGNISSWIANDLSCDDIVLSHSNTCSSGLHALLNGVAWLQAGFNDKFIVGASEAPLTPFTIAQMKALKIYASNANEFPCQSLLFDKKENSMVLGEGAVAIILDNTDTEIALAYISGIGYATEKLTHHVSLSDDGQSLYKAMKMAVAETDLKTIDAVVMHAPGTIAGDKAEFEAVKKLFGDDFPAITSNKWKVGHTLGTSGLMSLEMAILMMQNNKFIESPYFKNDKPPKKINRILVNAVGFGGNAVSVLVEKN